MQLAELSVRQRYPTVLDGTTAAAGSGKDFAEVLTLRPAGFVVSLFVPGQFGFFVGEVEQAAASL